MGDLLVAMTPRGLVGLYYEDGDLEALLDRLADRISPRVVEAPARVDPVRRELDEYFAGARREFETPVDWRLTRGFTRRVLRATARIPYGDASTYREVAARAGSGRAVRAAGNALGANPVPIVVPCHRVLRTGGALGGYGGGVERKRYLLELEGVAT
jgi:methylated-DNA-[protein]-cysteine S-methyltransferase